MSENVFVDRFSKQTQSYARARPGYPRELYRFLAEKAPDTQNAWDCATGNGQAAIQLADFFSNVFATDASAEQISRAFPHERITYSTATAEQSGLKDHSVDVITVAQAMHWFDLNLFYTEVQRVARPGAIFAAWAYGFAQAENKDIQKFFEYIGKELLSNYWDPHVFKIWRGYEKLPFPFERISHDPWEIKVEWTRDDFVQYMMSWSASQKFLDQTGKDIIEATDNKIMDVWLDGQEKIVFRTPLTTLIGRVK